MDEASTVVLVQPETAWRPLAYHIWSAAETIADLSGLVELAPGDLIFVGTPENVGAVRRGDQLEASIEGIGELQVTIA